MRVKVIQLVATGAAAFPLLLHLKGEAVDTGEVVGSVLLTSFAGIASWALWFYGRRYIGELALVYLPASAPEAGAAASDVPSAHRMHAGDAGIHGVYLQLSTLDFWGRRQDVLVEPGALQPPLAGLTDEQMRALAAATFVPLTVHGGQQYLLSLRHGKRLQPRLLREVLAGEWGAARESVRTLQQAAPSATAGGA